VGKQQGGVYYLVNEDLAKYHIDLLDKLVHMRAKPCAATSLVDLMSKNKLASHRCTTTQRECIVNKNTLWHLRLGHAPLSRIRHVVDIDKNKHEEICLTCPMSKFFKLPYPLSHTKSQQLFNLVHMDVWGPYRVPTHRVCRYFMTLVDDKRKARWTYLMQ